MSVRRVLAASLVAASACGAAPAVLAADAVVTVPFKAVATISEAMGLPDQACFMSGLPGSAMLGQSQGVGLGAPVGAFTFVAVDCVTSQSLYGSGRFDPPFTFNGRSFVLRSPAGELHATYVGTGTMLSATALSLEGQFTFTGGTGRYANASGSGTLEAVEDVTNPMQAKGYLTLKGKLTLPR